jgi:hypothetical protein
MDLLSAFSLSARPLPRGKINHPVRPRRILAYGALLKTLHILLGYFFLVDGCPSSLLLLLALGFLHSPFRLVLLLLCRELLALGPFDGRTPLLSQLRTEVYLTPILS